MSGMGSEADTAARLGAWLVQMGFPRPISREHLLTMCRGNYRAVWECLLKQVQPQTEVRSRRLQVFVSDVKHCKSFGDDLLEKLGCGIVSEELEVWRDSQTLRARVAQAESRVLQAKQQLQSLSTSVAEKVSLRGRINNNLKEMRQQSNSLLTLTEQLHTRAERLCEMTRLADQLTPATSVKNDENEVRKVIENCLSVVSGFSNNKLANANCQDGLSVLVNKLNSTAISNSAASNADRRDHESFADMQDKIIELMDEVNIADVWHIFHSKQDKLISSMVNSAISEHTNLSDYSSQSVIAETSALHCKIALRTLEIKQRVAALKKKLVKVMKCAVQSDGDEAARELLVLQCEEESLRSRVTVLRDQLAAIKHRTGLYQLQQADTSEDNVDAIVENVSSVNHDIVAKKSDLEALLILSEQTGVKIASVIVQLETLLPLRSSDLPVGSKLNDITQGNYDEFVRHFRGSEPDMSAGHRLSQLKEFYFTQQTRCRDLSLYLDCSTDEDTSASSTPSLIDELRYFMDKFNLNANRKLVLPNGESVWILETLERSRNKHYSCLRQVVLAGITIETYDCLMGQRESSLRMREALGWTTPCCVITDGIEHAATEKLEHIKKLARDSAVSMHQISAQLDTGLSNLKWWNSGHISKFISAHRMISGKPYSYYESVFTEYINNEFDKFM